MKPHKRDPENVFKVDLDRIDDLNGLDLDVPVTSAWLNEALGKDTIYKAAGDGQLTVHLSRLDDVVHVRGRARLSLTGTCGRCLTAVPITLDTPVELALFPSGQEPTPDESGEVTDADMGVATYEGEEIDLTGLVRDEAFLELPMNPLCTETCLGLCPSCGKNRNEGLCNHTGDVRARWGAFSNLKAN